MKDDKTALVTYEQLLFPFFRTGPYPQHPQCPCFLVRLLMPAILLGLCMP
jgi:hypothetical protein